MKKNDLPFSFQYECIGKRYIQEQTKYFGRRLDDSRRRAYRLLYGKLKGRSILDLGCGDGRDLLFFYRRGARVSGVDVSSTMVNFAREKIGKRGEIKQGTMDHIPYQDGSFDLVYSRFSIHYDLDLSRVFKEVWRVLRPGGELVAIISHPLLNFAVSTPPVYGVKQMVDVPIFDLSNPVIVRHPAHTFADYFSPFVLKHFDLIHFEEQDVQHRFKTVGISVEIPEYFFIEFKKRSQ